VSRAGFEPTDALSNGVNRRPASLPPTRLPTHLFHFVDPAGLEPTPIAFKRLLYQYENQEQNINYVYIQDKSQSTFHTLIYILNSHIRRHACPK